MEKGLEHLLQKLGEIRETNSRIQRIAEETKEVNARIKGSLEGLKKIETVIDLSMRLIRLYYNLLEKGDGRAYEILDVMASKKDSQDPYSMWWGALEYLEANHLDLYRQIQTCKLQT